MKTLPLKLILISTIILSLPSCSDASEIENRGLVIVLGIDKSSKIGDYGENNFVVTALLPDVSGISGNSENKKSIITAEGETLTTAISNADRKTSKSLYYGHAKAVVFGNSLLNDPEMLKEATDALERNRNLSRRLTILAADGNAEDIVNSDPTEESLLGIYITNFFKDNTNAANLTVSQNLEDFISNIRTNGNAILPIITSEDGAPKIGGAYVAGADGWLFDSQTRGVLWIRGLGKSAVLQAEIIADELPNGVKVTFTTAKSNGKVRFTENSDNNGLVCRINVTAEGSVSEYSLFEEDVSSIDLLEILETKFEDIIADDIISLADCLLGETKTDALSFREMLRKFNWNLYKKYAENDEDWKDAFPNIELEIYTDVRITNTGAVK